MVRVMSGFLLCVCLFGPSFDVQAKRNSKPVVIPTTLTIGALLDLSKYDDHTGAVIQAGLELSVKNFNRSQIKKKSKNRVKLLVKNSLGNPERAKELMKVLYDQGVQIVMGPQTDVELKEVLPFAAKNEMILMSATSAMTSLSKSGDNLFRFIPDSKVQAKMVASKLSNDGVKTALLIYPDNDFGSDGAKQLKVQLGQQKVAVMGVHAYNPDTEGFQQLTANLLKQVSEARVKTSLGEIAVIMVGDAKADDLFGFADRYSLLKKVRWYNSSVTAVYGGLNKNLDADQFAFLTKYHTTILSVKPKSSAQRYAVGQLKASLKGKLGFSAFVAYDMVQVAATAFFESGLHQIKSYKQTLEQVALDKQGLTGVLTLNKAGDRDQVLLESRVVTKKGSRYVWSKE